MDRTFAKTNPYEKDFVLWLETQVKLLRQGRVSELDLKNLAEEVESILKRDKREVHNRLTVLLEYLLKYQFQPDKRSSSWTSTIGEQRRGLDLVFKDSPSLLKSYAPQVFEDSYEYAKCKASDETGLSLAAFPGTCPYTLTETLDENFLPERT